MQRILVAGPDSEIAARLSSAPALRDCSVEVVKDDAEALQHLRQYAFDVVLTTPQTHVREDLALVNEMCRISPGIKILLLVPETTNEEIIAALRAHVFACFSMPVNYDEVVAMVSRAIEETDWRDGIELLSSQPDWIALRVSCRKLAAERLIRFMTELRSDLPDAARDELITAFREILLNAMEHGTGFDPEQVIEVSAVRTRRSILYHFRDPGPGFARDELPHAAISNAPDNPLAHIEYREALGIRPGGFGILLAQHLVDEMIYNKTGNEVILIKYTT